MRRKGIRVAILLVLVTSLLVPALSGVSASTYGQNSFLYHRYGWSILPTYQFYYVNGTVSPQTSCDSQDVPTYARRFAPSQANTTLSQFIRSQTWVVSAQHQWNYDIGTAFSQFEANKPLAGEIFFMTEAHVRRGWRWAGYYTTLPGYVYTHILSEAIYKPNHVECDVWTQNPEQLSSGTTYTTEWIYWPEEGQDLYALPKTYGHAFGTYIYRWWNLIHQASRHGDPMDKISWRNDLGTFDPNTHYLALGATSGSSLLLSQSEAADQAAPSPDDYLQARLSLLSSIPGDTPVWAMVSLAGPVPMDEARQLIAEGIDVVSVGYVSGKGQGEFMPERGLSLDESAYSFESALGRRVDAVTHLVVIGSASLLRSLQDQDVVVLVDPADSPDTLGLPLRPWIR